MVCPSRPTLFGVILFIAVSAASQARQEPASFGFPASPLDSLVTRARDQNATLRADRLGAEAMGYRSGQVSARPDPMAGVTILPTPPSPWLGFQRSQWRLEQELMYPGKRYHMGRMAELEAEEMSAGVEAMALDVEMEVKMAYFDLLRTVRQIRIIRDFQDDLRRFEDIAATRYEVGSGSQGAILMAQLERGQMELQIERLLQAGRSARARLAWLINEPNGVELTDSEPDHPEVPAAFPPVDSLSALAMRIRPEAAAIRLAVERGHTQFELARLQGRPDFMVMAMVGIADAEMPSMAGDRATLGLGVRVNLPVWKGKLRAAREEARVETLQSEARLDELEIRIRTAVADILQQLDGRRNQMALLDEVLIPQAETTREAALSAYTTGRSGFLDLLEVERMLFMLRMERIDLDAMLHETFARLEQAVGADRLEAQF